MAFTYIISTFIVDIPYLTASSAKIEELFDVTFRCIALSKLIAAICQFTKYVYICKLYFSKISPIKIAKNNDN